MKLERLYAITVYLLNHGRTSASELAKHFEVSLRTIQRDMDSLCLAGIPVISVAGAAGGYEISEKYKLDNGFATMDDYSNIQTALQGLISATGDSKAKHTLEKIIHVSNTSDNSIILDFSVLQEGDRDTLQLLQTAVYEKRTVTFTYTKKEPARARVIEYLKGTVTEELPDGDAIIKATVVENEHFWLGTLLSLGDNAEIIAPEKLRRQLLKSAEKIISLYKEL